MSLPPYGVKPGRRRAGPHRCPSVGHALGWTVLSAVVPGSGFLHNRRPRLGALSTERPCSGRPAGGPLTTTRVGVPVSVMRR